MWTPDSLPTRFGRYDVRRRLGRGGMGTVYEAIDMQLGRKVALKVSHFSSAEQSSNFERFCREAKAAASLLNPHICPVYDMEEVGGVPYLAMAYIEGKRLNEIAPPGQLPVEQATTIVAKVALAMQEAHNSGVIHRDLKPENILINQRGEPVIVDFGLARMNKKETRRLTQPGMRMGTPEYMAPEQLKGDLDSMDKGCDIYSLGVILYELLTGTVPFEGTPDIVLAQVMTQKVPALSTFRGDVDRRLERICRKAMALDPSDRYGSMEEFAAALEFATGLNRPASRIIRQPSRTPWCWLVAGNLGFLLLLVACLVEQAAVPIPEPVLAFLSTNMLQVIAGLAAANSVFVMLLAVLQRARPNTRWRVGDSAPGSSERAASTDHPERALQETDPSTPGAPRDPPIEDVQTHKRAIRELTQIKDKYERIKRSLAKAVQAKTYHQPILVVGPKNVSKTSLIKQWHAPWDYSLVEGTTTHRVCSVPIVSFVEPNKVPHFAVPEVMVSLRTHLVLRVHDFPGEIKAQRLIGTIIRDETAKLRKTKKDLGVVIICMFDAEEAYVGIRRETNEYYNGELFRELRGLVAHDTVGVERLILVFNKFDLLRARYPRDTADRELLELCLKAFAATCDPLRGVVNPERICSPIPTILAREDMAYKNQGAPIVLGAAAKLFCEAFLGQAAARDVEFERDIAAAAQMGW